MSPLDTTPQTAAPPLASLLASVVAEIQADVLVRSFIIGLVLVIPYWMHKKRQLRRPPAPSGTDPAEPDHPPLPRLEDVIAEVDQAAGRALECGSATLTVPSDVTIDGRPAEAGTVDALVRDALRRSGLAVAAELDSPTGRRLECRPIGSAGSTRSRRDTDTTRPEQAGPP